MSIFLIFSIQKRRNDQTRDTGGRQESLSTARIESVVVIIKDVYLVSNMEIRIKKSNLAISLEDND